MSQSDGRHEDLQEGEVFAGYTIVRRLGAGGMGQVYLAQHPRLPRRDALKILPHNLTENDEFRQRFNREADLAASLYNEHIVGIHDRGESEGRLWISMDYVEGTDASNLLHEKYPSGMPQADVIEIITAVADALDYAHSRGLLHRDVKPANILLTEANPRRRTLLADFGIARELGDISGLTATNMLVGTTAYCAPEQLQGADMDGRADQYALGCTAFNLLAGSAPFHASNPAVVITQHLSAPPPHISERRPELVKLDSVLAKAMAKKPEDRYTTCSDFAAALSGRMDTVPQYTAEPTSQFNEAGAAPTQAVAAPTQAVAAPTQAVAVPTEVIAAPRTGPQAPTKPPSGRRTALLVGVVVAVVLAGAALVVVPRLMGGKTNRPQTNASSTSVASPGPSAAPTTATGMKLTSQITDQSNVLNALEHAEVERAVTRLLNGRGTKLWVVYVPSFGGIKPFKWAEDTMRASGFGDSDSILAIATDTPAFWFGVPSAITIGKAIDVEGIRRDRVRPAVFRHEWTRAAIAAANGLDVAPS